MSQLTIKAQITQNGFKANTFPTKNGQSSTKDFVIEWTENKYAKQLVVTAWNKTIEEMEDAIGNGERTFHIEATSRYNKDKWYTSVKVWRIS